MEIDRIVNNLINCSRKNANTEKIEWNKISGFVIADDIHSLFSSWHENGIRQLIVSMYHFILIFRPFSVSQRFVYSLGRECMLWKSFVWRWRNHK